jgi:hypothetical protein
MAPAHRPKSDSGSTESGTANVRIGKSTRPVLDPSNCFRSTLAMHDSHGQSGFTYRPGAARGLARGNRPKDCREFRKAHTPAIKTGESRSHCCQESHGTAFASILDRGGFKRLMCHAGENSDAERNRHATPRRREARVQRRILDRALSHPWTARRRRHGSRLSCPADPSSASGCAQGCSRPVRRRDRAHAS